MRKPMRRLVLWIQNQKESSRAIDKMAVGRTTIIIAHRLSTIKNSNTIAVVENGQVKEIGPHNELIQERNGLYKSLVCLQQMEKEISLSPSKKDSNISTSNVCNSKKLPSSPTLVLSNHCFKDLNDTPRSLFWRFLDLNKSEWKQATLGCLSAILSGVIMHLRSVIVGVTISVYFSTNQGEIKERIRNQVLWLFGFSAFSILFNIYQHYSFAD
ncbi:ABC-1 type transporter [Parasponia andersonii]|uniref:ABC-1 type transporter n=1 Tax=Parasponia andersonii TaxID=3476 RepID=A0A2P5CUA4_PARAD|nr:ABC-1 type transporter [Parasponia andersonii]